MTLPKTAKDALQMGEKYYFTGRPCVNNHVANRLAEKRECVVCIKDKLQKHEDKEIRKAKKVEYYQANKSYIAKRNSTWAKNNKGKVTFKTKRYIHAKKNRQPSWLSLSDVFEMECIYLYAGALNKVGLSYHVDHMIPLRGKLVSGLHIPENLQVIPAVENMRKQNTFRIS